MTAAKDLDMWVLERLGTGTVADDEFRGSASREDLSHSLRRLELRKRIKRVLNGWARA